MTVIAGIYTRMSHVLDDDRTKVEDQARICRELAGRLGWEVGPVYTDNKRSAWQRNRKRPDWDAMLQAVEEGRISAVVTYHGDRLIRQPRDLEDLIELARGKGVRLASPTGTRDLGVADDQFILRIEAAQACKASDDTSRRVKAWHERRRRAGVSRGGGPGGRAFGWRTDGVTLFGADRCELAARRTLAESDLIREMGERVLGGESTWSVARNLNARGYDTPAGNPWRHATVRDLLCSPRVAALMPDGEGKGAWAPVFEREEWERLRLVLGVRASRFTAASSARKYLLSGIAVCDACGSPLQTGWAGATATREAAPGYTCVQRGCGKVRRNCEHLDAYVLAAVAAHLQDDGYAAGRPPEQPGLGAEWAALEAERAETEALAADYSGSAGRVRLLMARLDGIDERMAQLRDLTDTSGRDRLLRRYRGTSLAQLKALPLDVKRALVEATVTVTVLRASGRGPGFRQQDVRVEEVG